MEPRHGAKGDTVVDYLMRAIQAGRFVPGQRLVEALLVECLLGGNERVARLGLLLIGCFVDGRARGPRRGG